jgi:hypothetical protein
MLPDVVLLEIFDFYLGEEQVDYADEEHIEAWHTLVHVCQKWRNVVFGSPHRLDLRLQCTARTPVRETLDAWPPLPIIIRAYNIEMRGPDNIIAALEHGHRICRITVFGVSNSQMGHVLAAMQQPFPTLTRLELGVEDKTAPIVPASFLGGSAPNLRTLFLDCVPFPRLPKLLLTATHLVDLGLRRIPHSGYISPEAMATCLSVLAKLEKLVIRFESPRSRPGWNSGRRRPPPPPRTLLPVLTESGSKGPVSIWRTSWPGLMPLYLTTW